jgi:hypothetical protein
MGLLREIAYVLHGRCENDYLEVLRHLVEEFVYSWPHQKLPRKRRG